LTKARLLELDRAFELGTPQPEPKHAFIEALAQSKSATFGRVLEQLSLTELKHICRVHELASSGTKAELQARLLGNAAPAKAERTQAPLFLEAEEADGIDARVAAFLMRSQPSVAGIVPRLTPLEVSTLLRRLAEQHGIVVDLGRFEPSPENLGRALAEACPLPIVLSELSREQLDRLCQHYGLSPEATTREGYVRALLAAAAGITEDEARAIEDAATLPAEAEPTRGSEAAPTPGRAGASGAGTARHEAARAPGASTSHAEATRHAEATGEAAQAEYREALAALPRGIHRRVERSTSPTELPSAGELVRVRQRQYLVTEVVLPGEPATRRPGAPAPSPLVRLVCLDDDAQGRSLEVLWDLELGARRIDPEQHGLGAVPSFDPPAKFAAYYRALQWNGVTTATRPEQERVQAPFRAGIAVMQHQLVPLQKALALPRANLFVADDVGLGKTIEAGLVIQELLLRQRLELLLIVCPASICLQWQGEMERRFGVRLEIVNREFMARIRKERGFATNPWTCGRRFIVSYQTLRRPEYREGLLALGHRIPKSMLVFDEVHTVAPASPGRYAVDSQLTKLARQLAPKFENRLFLSATPHNGHSNSFSALLELLDPARFTRGVPIEDRSELEAVMVRRLKQDLAGVSTLRFPQRKVVELQVERTGGQWTVARQVAGGQASAATVLGEATSPEIELSELLREYTDVCAPATKRDRMVFIGLQKRLLSSVAAFAHTLRVHRQHSGAKILAALGDATEGDGTRRGRTGAPDPSDRVSAGDGRRRGAVEAASTGGGHRRDDADTETSRGHAGAHEDGTIDDETYGEEYDAAVDRTVVAGRSVLPRDEDRRARAEALLAQMETLVRGASRRPTGKLLALLQWIRTHQCPSAGSAWLGAPAKPSTAWSPTRLIVFTEYAHTATYVLEMLRAALADTDRGDERVAYFHGAMSDEQRRELQAQFNAPPEKTRVRILVATDAAREGVNLQAFCADMLHYDIPWNPGRLEQRNGRIDRTLQPSPEVRCMYFRYPQRAEDRVLAVLVEKVQRITRELGSLSQVVLDRLEAALEPYGIDDEAQRRIEWASEGSPDEADTARREVEIVRATGATLQRELDAAADCYARSKAFFAPDAEALRDTLQIALQMAGAADEGRLKPLPMQDGARGDSQHYAVPALSDDWQPTLDTLRPPRPAAIPPWEWRRATPPLPVVFEPLARMTDEVVQLHLEHPFVKRALSRFTAQGYGVHDLHRATVLRYGGSHERVVLVGRLSLFGQGATRLHDSLVHLVAELREGGEVRRLETRAAQEKALTEMRQALHHRPDDWSPAQAFLERRRAHLPTHVGALWPLLKAQAEDEAAELVRLLDDRGAREAEALVEILDHQASAIRRTLAREHTVEGDEAETRQQRLDRLAMEERLQALATERATEPARLRTHYKVLRTRIDVVGLLYLVPASR